jgi:PTH1 family peptidyl-tRNA hydrolase
MKLVVGLGNPGREYLGTRHNVGFEVVEQLASQLGWIGSPEQFKLRAKSRFNGLTLDGLISLATGQEKVLLLEPMTYMNLSGNSILAAMTFYQVSPVDLMVVLDDVALPAGRLRLRASGSSGGHNGLKDIERALGTMDYPRLRVGIDAPPPPIEQKDYVLGKFTAEQRRLIDPAIRRACDAIVTWAERGIERAMNQFNAE